MSVVEDRLELLESLRLEHGSHHDFEEGVCAMEAAAWVAGEPHSDHPPCVSPVITAFMVTWNDSLATDDDRDRLLKPLIPLLIGTHTTPADEEVRAWMCTDWLVRVQAPAWLRLAGLTEHAEALEDLEAVTGSEAAIVAHPALNEARKAGAAAGASAGAAAWNEARKAAWNAARNAARNEAWNAAGEAAREASRNASRDAAGDEAREAAGAAAWEAARNAAGAAAGAALSPTVEILQASAALLVTRMCEVGR